MQTMQMCILYTYINKYFRKAVTVCNTLPQGNHNSFLWVGIVFLDVSINVPRGNHNRIKLYLFI